MHFLSLKFKNLLLESKYLKSRIEETLNRYFSFVTTVLALSFFMIAYNLVISPNKLIAAAQMATILFVLIILYVCKKYSCPILIYLLKLCYISCIVLFVELVNSCLKASFLHDNAICLAIPFQLTLSVINHTKASWFSCSFTYLLSLVYFFIRNVNTSYDQNPNYITVFIGMFFCYFIFTYMAYFQEKLEKTNFKIIEEASENLNYFKLLLQNIIPSPIFIVNYEKSVMNFANNPALKLLETHFYEKKFK